MIRDALAGLAERRLTRWTALALAGALSIAALWAAYVSIRDWQFRDLDEQARRNLDLYAVELGLTLAQFEAVPDLIAKHPAIVSFMSGSKDDPEEVERLNRLLETMNAEVGSSDVYVMDRTGMTFIASNWRSAAPFVGKSFEYRPYFRQALAGGRGRFFGLGTTSGVRGHFFSAPVRDGLGRIIGVVAVKVPSGPLEDLWNAPGTLIVTDELGIVFLSSDPAWVYGALSAVTESGMAQLIATRRYDLEKVRPLPIRIEAQLPLGALVEPEAGEPALLDGEHLMVSRKVPVMAATGTVLVPTADARFRSLMLTLLTGFAVASLWLVVLALVQYQQNLSQRRRFEAERAKHLEEWAGELEARVVERTRELRQANDALSVEIGERESMADRLRAMQGDLIQSEKLAALGKISAGINHELNQPIGAVLAYADNARKFLERGMNDRAEENLKEIAELCDRMGRIVRDLKVYSRQEPVTVEVLGLRKPLGSALRILRHRISDLGVEVTGLETVPDIQVLGAETGLTQVLTNLVSNAADAMAENDGPRRLTVSVDWPDLATITVILADTGPGIPEESQDRLFDPFFSTKKGEKGMGLGLAISRNVMRSFGGDLSARNRPDGGAAFYISLKRAVPMSAVAE